MPNIGLLYDAAVLDHQPPPGHPERPARVREVMARIDGSALAARLTRLPVRQATFDELARVHSSNYLRAVQQVVSEGGGYLDAGDTFASPGSWLAATTAAGAGIGTVDAVLSGTVDAAFAVVRPPGHHAPRDHAMGFCLVNNAAVAAAHATAVHGLTRLLLVDFDVHHGNGTQDIFYETDQVLYFSTHQFPAYPGTGRLEETGTGPGLGYTVNVPLPADVGDDGFLEAFDSVLRPLADRYQPQLVIVSAGYDAHWRNSAYVNGIRERMTVTGFAALAARLWDIAQIHCPGRLVGILEGGYDLASLSDSVLATLGIWLGDQDIEDPIGLPPNTVPAPDILPLLARVRAAHDL